jgi:hypothetical protein
MGPHAVEVTETRLSEFLHAQSLGVVAGDPCDGLRRPMALIAQGCNGPQPRSRGATRDAISNLALNHTSHQGASEQPIETPPLPDTGSPILHNWEYTPSRPSANPI